MPAAAMMVAAVMVFVVFMVFMVMIADGVGFIIEASFGECLSRFIGRAGNSGVEGYSRFGKRTSCSAAYASAYQGVNLRCR